MLGWPSQEQEAEGKEQARLPPPASLSLQRPLLAESNGSRGPRSHVVGRVPSWASQRWARKVGLELKDDYFLTGPSFLVSHISGHAPYPGWTPLGCSALQCTIPQFPHRRCYICMGCRWLSAKGVSPNRTEECPWCVLMQDTPWVPRSLCWAVSPCSEEASPFPETLGLGREGGQAMLFSLPSSACPAPFCHMCSPRRSTDTSSGVWPLQKGIIWFLRKVENIR